MKDLSFSIADSEMKSVSGLKSEGAMIVGNNCSRIAPNSSCSINFVIPGAGTVTVLGKILNKQVLSFSTSTYLMTVQDSGDLANALLIENDVVNMVLRPNNSVPGSYFGAMSFSVVNTHNGPVDVANLFSTLPTNVTYSPINCPNPLPFGGVCQVRLTYNGPITSEIAVNLEPRGEIINPNGSKTPLPAQNSKTALVVSDAKIANIIVEDPSLNLDGNNPTSNNTTEGVIINSGTAPANIDSLTLADNGSGVFSISDNKCTGSLGAGSSCTYKITADVSKLSNLVSGSYITGIILSYNNGKSAKLASGELSYRYTTIISPTSLNIGITAPSVLNQSNLTGSVTITNNSNVGLTNLTAPTLSGATSHVSLSDPNSCGSKTIAVGGSCSYSLTYSPQAPSETATVTISGVSAKYTDPVSGSIKEMSFTNSTSVNLNSSFAGILSLNGVQSLNQTTPTGTITVTNTGNHNATLSNIAITSSGTNNIQRTSGTCSNSTTLTASGTANSSCTIVVGITNTAAANSGVSDVIVTYNNNNGTTNATGSSNVNWIIGAAPSLAVAFSTNTLSAVVNQSVTTTLTLTNDGNNTLSNIQLPTLTSLSAPMNTALTYERASSNACNLVGQQLSSQTLTQGSSCEVILKYAPSTVFTSQSISLGMFSAMHSGTQSYTTNTYSITLSATSASQMSFLTVSGNPVTSLNPSLNWTNNTNYSQSIVLTNIGGSPITSLSISKTEDANGTLSASGCPNTLGVGAQCTLIITGNYPTQPNTFASNGSINISYSDAGNSHSRTIAVNANVAMMPVVTPGLSISGTIPSSMYAGASDRETVQLTLTNNTTATNGGNTTIEVARDSLTQNIGTNLSGTINTTGITTNACNISGANISLTGNQSCNVNLVLEASGNPSIIIATVSPTYQYNNYTSTSTTPNQTAATGSQLPTLSGSVTINARSASLNLAFFASDGTTPITSLAVEQGLTNPTAILKVTNTGTTRLTGITLPTVTGFTFNPDSSCNTLGEGLSCNVGVTLSSASVITATDITTNPANVVDFMYNNHLGARSDSSDLPSLTYEVSAPNSPSISVSTSFSGCGGGVTSTSQTCNLNPGSGNSAGIAGGYKFIVTYRNSGSGSALFTATPATLGNYGTAINNCDNITLAANTGTCTVEYSLSNPGTATSGNIPNGAVLGTYSYTYGSSNQLTGNGTATNPNQVNVNIAQQSFSLSLSASSILVNGTSTVTGILSNWYSIGIPSSITINSGTPATAANTTASCTISGSGAICTGTLTGLAGGTTNINSSITAPDGSIILATTSPSPLVLTVTPSTYFVAYYPNGCTVNNEGVNVTGTCECIRDPNTNKIWTAVGPNNTVTTGSWDDWTGSSLTTYNQSSHCGLTGGWSLPSAPSPSFNYMSSSNPGGDWGDIANAAGMTGSDFAIVHWMNDNGFKGIDPINFYWSSQSYNNNDAWIVYLANGTVFDDVKRFPNNRVLLVHP